MTELTKKERERQRLVGRIATQTREKNKKKTEVVIIANTIIRAGQVTIFEDGSLCRDHMSLDSQIICNNSDREAIGAYLAPAITEHSLGTREISPNNRDRMNHIIIPTFFNPERKKEEVKEILK